MIFLPCRCGRVGGREGRRERERERERGGKTGMRKGSYGREEEAFLCLLHESAS
jgi:hypothetical protein